jgi:hypothetical protein
MNRTLRQDQLHLVRALACLALAMSCSAKAANFECGSPLEPRSCATAGGFYAEGWCFGPSGSQTIGDSGNLRLCTNAELEAAGTQGAMQKQFWDRERARHEKAITDQEEFDKQLAQEREDCAKRPSVHLGMSATEAASSNWGMPIRKHILETSSDNREYWDYRSAYDTPPRPCTSYGRGLIFENGILIAIER